MIMSKEVLHFSIKMTRLYLYQLLTGNKILKMNLQFPAIIIYICKFCVILQISSVKPAPKPDHNISGAYPEGGAGGQEPQVGSPSPVGPPPNEMTLCTGVYGDLSF